MSAAERAILQARLIGLLAEVKALRAQLGEEEPVAPMDLDEARAQKAREKARKALDRGGFTR